MFRPLPALLMALATCTAGAQDDVKLPDFGSSAGGIISPDEERRIGEGMMRELRGLHYLLDDPELTDYVESLGYRLVAQTDRPDQEFTFFLVRSEEINAFAAPGGYVGINTGLFAMAEAESELAAVLAHEVAHVTQRHLVRAFENIKNASIPIALAMIGAIIAAQGAGSGDAAQAAVVG
ncbi:MAG TPA: M48 family metalloprotease, partial [Candidatus Saccharimonadia bacterium]|nr:M48 family metalloprotease [Candidatus Saccharimonadia bacterium]